MITAIKQQQEAHKRHVDQLTAYLDEATAKGWHEDALGYEGALATAKAWGRSLQELLNLAEVAACSN